LAHPVSIWLPVAESPFHVTVGCIHISCRFTQVATQHQALYFPDPVWRHDLFNIAAMLFTLVFSFKNQ
jgi:hypothetical protein